MNTEIPLYIFSAASTACGNAENKARHKMLRGQLRGYGLAIAECDGQYNGVNERSILVIDEKPVSLSTRGTVMRLARAWGQESILEVDANRSARLVFTNGNSAESLGKFAAVTSQYAKHANAWTRRNNQYYCCVPIGSTGGQV